MNDIVCPLNNLIKLHGEFACDNTNPGVVFLKGDVPKDIIDYSSRVVRSIVQKNDAMRLINNYKLDFLERHKSFVKIKQDI